MQKFFETDLWGVLSVPFTMLVFIACAIGFMWICHFAAMLTWLVPA